MPDPARDVIVLGSGAAGLSAALSAAHGGAKVSVLERTDKVGGTTAVSGGGMWFPGNHLMQPPDDRDEALTYCRWMVAGRMPEELLVAFVDASPGVAAWLERATPLSLHVVSWPDYHPEGPGARTCGRMLEPDPFDATVLAEWASRVRRGPVMTAPITLEEQTVEWRLGYTPEKLDVALLKKRSAAGVVTGGRALVSALLAACLDAGVEVLTETRAVGWHRQGARIAGVETEGGQAFPAASVVLATGGFEWDEQLKRSFLPGPLTHPHSPPGAAGDGLRLAMDAGAALANMTEAWWYPAASVPGEAYDGAPLARFVGTERTAPHTIMVNRSGRRFTNEAANYNDMMKAMFAFDGGRYRWANQPSWVVADARYRRRYHLATVRAGEPDPEWLVRSETLEGLAEQLGIDPGGLVETVERFNRHACRGEDPEFGRGESFYDRFHGDPDAPHPTLGTIEEPPFFAMQVHPGCVGTKGGPLTDASGRVLDVRGEPIPGLFGAGNVIASPAGPAYFGGGCSIAMALVWGCAAGTATVL